MRARAKERKSERAKELKREKGEKFTSLGKRAREREREREKERHTHRERHTINRLGVDIVAINVIAATVPKPCVTSSRPVFEEKRGK